MQVPKQTNITISIHVLHKQTNKQIKDTVCTHVTCTVTLLVLKGNPLLSRGMRMDEAVGMRDIMD